MVRKHMRFVMMVSVLLMFSAGFLFADYQGLSVSTTYPSLNVSDTSMITFNLTVRNYNLAPQRVNLSVEGLPEGWDYQFVGGDALVDAVFADPQQSASIQLWVIPNGAAKGSTYSFNVVAKGDDGVSYSLPLTVSLGKKLPQRLALSTELPSIKGSPDSDFSFQVELRNNSATETLIDLYAKLPEGFSAKFSQQYGSGNVNTLSVKPGASETIKVTITPSQGVKEGTYPVTVTAKSSEASAFVTENLEVQGQARLSLTGKGGLLSGSAVAGKDKVFDLELKNSGTADAKGIKLSSSTPSNWNVTFNPSSVEDLAAGDTATVKATIRPSSEALTGDYSLALSASSENSGNISEQYRITVKTSSMWGIISVIIIAAAALLLVFAVKKFGRR
ncbi:MAG: NEW3 domain-containing protein [Sphaerochaetaceae bacterium]